MSKKPEAVNREFDVKKSKDGQWRWHARASNGEITFQGQGHPEANKAVRAIKQELDALGATEPVIINVDHDGKIESTRTKPRIPKPTTLELLDQLGQPKAVKEIARAVAQAGLGDEDDIQESVDMISEFLHETKAVVEDPNGFRERREREDAVFLQELNKRRGGKEVSQLEEEIEHASQVDTLAQASTGDLLSALGQEHHREAIGEAMLQAGFHPDNVTPALWHWDSQLDNTTRLVNDPEAYKQERAQQILEARDEMRDDIAVKAARAAELIANPVQQRSPWDWTNTGAPAVGAPAPISMQQGEQSLRRH